MFSAFLWSLTENLITCESAKELQRRFNSARTRAAVGRSVMTAACLLVRSSAAPAAVLVPHTPLFWGSINTGFHAFKQLSC